MLGTGVEARRPLVINEVWQVGSVGASSLHIGLIDALSLRVRVVGVCLCVAVSALWRECALCRVWLRCRATGGLVCLCAVGFTAVASTAVARPVGRQER